MRKALSFLSNNWILLLAAVTAASLIHFYYKIYVIESLSEMMAYTSQKLKDLSNASDNYSNGLRLGLFLANLFHSIDGVIGLIGVSILLAEFHYRMLFKELFVSSGNSGKFFYFIVVLLIGLFLYFCIKLSFPATDKELSIIGISTTIMTLVSVIYSTIKYVNDSYTRLRKLSFEKTKAELSALKAQINPHFLFNTLNNLYGQAIVEDSPKTAEGIENLSRIMRHVVEETKTERSPIDKEIQFIEDYLKLQKMRLPERDNINLQIDIQWDNQEDKIAPLLVIPYIENAFKYGISMNDPSFINLKLHVKNHHFSFHIANSLIKEKDKLEIGTNTGLENTNKRLKLHYPDRHKLAIENSDHVFKVDLEIEL